MSIRRAARLNLPMLLVVCLATGCGIERSAMLKPPVANAADVMLRGGKIYTADPARPQAEAVALAHGRILAVGSNDEIARHAGPATRIVELDGRMVLPGLHDSHMHPMSAGLWFLRCRLYDAADIDALRKLVRACDAKLAGGEWLIGRGWREEAFGDIEPARVFDRIVLQRPAVLMSAQGDRMWLNARAFEALGFSEAKGATADEGVEQDRFGKRSGFVHGSAASKVRRSLPQPTQQEHRRSLLLVSALLNARGVTAATDASVSAPMLEAYRAAERAGELTVRMTLAQRFDPVSGVGALAHTFAAPGVAAPAMLRDNVVKIFVDGDFPERTAAILEPYADAPASRGELFVPAKELDRAVVALDAAGFDLHFHAMGDRAVRSTLDAIERAHRANGVRDRRHQIAHLALVDRADMPRFRELGVIANLQLAWATPDGFAEVEALQRLGPLRSGRLLAFAELAAQGAMLVAGSDGPAPSLDPFESIEIGATRRAADGSGAVLHPSQVLRVPELLQALTRNGAYAARADRSSGKIAPGFAADLVVIDRDLLQVDPEKISETRVLLTLLGGRAVYIAPEFPWPK